MDHDWILTSRTPPSPDRLVVGIDPLGGPFLCERVTIRNRKGECVGYRWMTAGLVACDEPKYYFNIPDVPPLELLET